MAPPSGFEPETVGLEGPREPPVISDGCDRLGPAAGPALHEAAYRYLEAVEAESPFVIRRGIELAELALAFEVANTAAESDAGSA